jgi:hypothetical protein
LSLLESEIPKSPELPESESLDELPGPGEAALRLDELRAGGHRDIHRDWQA